MARGIHVLFLSAHGGMGADAAVHVSLARTLDRNQVRVSAATSAHEPPGASAREAFERIPDLTLLPLELGRTFGEQHGLGKAVTMLHNLHGMANLVTLARWCRENDVDVIHVTERPRQALFGLLLARLSGCACVVQAHTSFYPHDATRLANWRLHQADAVVGVSHFTANTYLRLANLAPDRVFAVHNAVDGVVFRPEPTHRAAMRQRLGLPADVPVIGCVARLMRWKGQGTLLEAFVLVRKTIPSAQLVLAGLSADSSPDGDGTYRDYLVRRIGALGLEECVKLPGFLPQSDMPSFYSALDVVAHPSIEEPFGLAVVEAMACLRPVVAIGGGGILEIIRDEENGLLVPAEQPEAMANAITRLFGNPAFAQHLAISARQHVLERFTPAIQAAAMLKVYQEVVDRRGSAHRLHRDDAQPHRHRYAPLQ